jgi:hypothetical protein
MAWEGGVVLVAKEEEELTFSLVEHEEQVFSVQRCCWKQVEQG